MNNPSYRGRVSLGVVAANLVVNLIANPSCRLQSPYICSPLHCGWSHLVNTYTMPCCILHTVTQHWCIMMAASLINVDEAT